MPKLYESERWLRMVYLRQKKSPEEIAKMCGVNKQTIYRWLHKYSLIKSHKPRSY